MQTSRKARWIALFLSAATLLIGASSLRAAEPAGESPFDGQTVTCQVRNLAPGGATWYKIPYHTGVDLELDLTAIDGVYFDVLAPDQVRNWPAVGQPMGTSAPSPVDPVYLKTWQGHMELGEYILDFYYVHLTSLLGFETSYILCSHETAVATLEPMGDSPANGLTVASCSLRMLDPVAQVWYKIPYHTGNQLEIYLKTLSPGMGFDVFTPAQIKAWPTLDQPIGRGTVNKNEPEFALSWEGHLLNSDYYSILARNATSTLVPYQLCWAERKLEGLAPTRTPRPPTPTRQPVGRIP
jgi:hypothetical protein